MKLSLIMKSMLSVVVVISLLLLLACSNKSQNESNDPTLTDSKVETHILYSNTNNQNYNIRVRLPKGYQASQSYQVIYLIDGYFWFNYVSEQIEALTSEGKLSEVILVGIGYEGLPLDVDGENEEIDALRFIDLTYPAVEENGENLGGGAIDFYQFINTELIPEIESIYTVDTTNRSLFGHSLGGLFAVFQMFNFHDDGLFKNVVASSPSIWWSDKYFLQLESQISGSNPEMPFNLYLSIGAFEGEDSNTDLDNLEASLIAHDYQDLTFQVDRYQTDHAETGSVAFASILETLFKKSTK